MLSDLQQEQMVTVLLLRVWLRRKRKHLRADQRGYELLCAAFIAGVEGQVLEPLSRIAGVIGVEAIIYQVYRAVAQCQMP